MKLAAVILLLLSVEASAAVIDCQPKYSGDSRPGNWSWRTIDGKQCWYKGPRMIDKDRLRWPVAPAQPDTEAASEAEQPRGVIPFAPAAAPAIEELREEVMPDERVVPEHDNAMPAPSLIDELTARAELLLFTCCWPEYVESIPLPRPKPVPPVPPFWLTVLLIVVPLVGAGLAYKFLRVTPTFIKERLGYGER